MFWPELVQNRLSQWMKGSRLAVGRAGLLALAGWFWVGCSREAIRTYEVPKETVQAATPANSAMAAPQPPGGNAVAWELPSGWEELEPNQFRVGNFRVTGEGGQTAEISIIPLPGMAGSDLDNVNRWRGQVGLGPVSEAQLGELAETVSVGDGEGHLFDLLGAARDGGEPVRMLAAIYRREATAWFVKMLGPASLVEAQKPALRALMASLRFGGSDAAATPPAVADEVASTGTSDDLPAWIVPAGWNKTAPGMMQLARFTVGGEAAAAAEVSVAVLGGDGGGMLANVNRWRRQLGLGPIGEAELQSTVLPLPDAGDGATLVPIDQPADGRKMLAAVVPAGGKTWFYKLVGDAAVVAQQQEAFTAFVKSAGHGR